MITSEGTEALIELENRAPEVLYSAVPGTDVQIWPLLRYPLAQTTAEMELGTLAVRRRASRAETISRYAKRMIPNPHSSRRVTRNRDYLFIVGGGTFRHTDQGRSNWLIDGFLEAVGDSSAVLQDRPIDAIVSPAEKPAFPATFSFQDSFNRIEVSTKLAPLSRSGTTFAREVIRETFREFRFPVSEERINHVENRLIYRLARIRHLNSEFERVLDRVSPNIVFMEDASYGGRSSLISILKDRGVLVVEPQHGWVGPAHGAYNFGAAMFSPPLSKRLPDVVLTFGDFWKGLIRHPARLISVGKPHLERLRTMPPPTNARNKAVLIVSSVYEPEQMAGFAKSVRDALPTDWSVIYRPHPSERSTLATRYASLIDEPRISFDKNSDVYESFGQVRAVFGLASTVLYEALAFDLQVFVKESPLTRYYIDDIFGEHIRDAATLELAIQMITTGNGRSSLSSEQVDSVWKPHAIANFRDFVVSLST